MFGFLRNPFKKRAADPAVDDSLWSAPFFMSPTASGVQVSQVTALSSSAVFACVTILAEDVAKIRPVLFRRRDDGGRDIVTDHWLARLLRRPNDWMTGFEFRYFMMVQLCLRANAYAVILRNQAGRPIKLVPINSDRAAIWESPDGALFYRMTPLGLHEMAQLAGQPFLIPAEDVLHFRALSFNGLLGASTIVLGKEAIGLSLAYEQQAAHWMRGGSKPSGVLETDQKLTKEAAERIGNDWKALYGGVQNTGRVPVLEQGLKFNKVAFDAQTMDFIKQRQFQLEDVARMLRIPLHMIASSSGGKGADAAVEQQADEYINLTITTHTTRIGEKLDATFDIEEMGLELGWDYSILTRASQGKRYTAYQKAISGGFLTPNEARIDDGRNPEEGGDHLWQPANVSWTGSQSNATLPTGGGRPPGAENKDD